MAVIKCKMCGGNLNIVEGTSVAECEYCGSKQTVPKVDDEKKLTLFSRANRLWLACEFDKAAGVYESIVADFPEEAEAYWGLVLCRYGIEYVDDPTTGKKIPTCHRSSFDSILEDSDFDQACENADPIARRLYRDEAKAIEDIRKGILEASGKEEPYDIFICYKETDENGGRTIDSVIAQDVYDALTEKGYRVFFSRISLEDKLGTEYEPYIFAALNSAKAMLVFGTDFEYFNAVWVKNEWSRFLKLMAQDKSKHLIPCYKNVDVYDMPKEFAKLQAQDMGKVGAIQDLLRGVEKILPLQKSGSAGIDSEDDDERGEDICSEESDDYKETEKELKRGKSHLEDGEWQEAYDCFDEAYCRADSDLQTLMAVIGRICAELGIHQIEQFVEGTSILSENTDHEQAVCLAELKAGHLFLQKKDWEAADKHFDMVIDEDPECSSAYIGKMMAYHNISCEEGITDYFCGKCLDISKDKYYKKALRFADSEYHARLESYNKRTQAETVDEVKMQELSEARQRNQKYKGRILAQGNRTVGIKFSGKVLATGENDSGECDTGSWNDVVSVALGSRHTVGLKKDGTVVSAGARDQLINMGQCETGKWTDIKAIAAASLFTVGLKSNGSFVHCGDAIRGQIKDASASGILSGVAKNVLGQMVLPKMMEWVSIYASSGEIYGLTKDGKVETINEYKACDNWNNIADVVVSQHGYAIGLRKNGTVVATGKNKYGECDVGRWNDIIAVATGGGQDNWTGKPFTVGLRTNGTVVAVGNNEYGQCCVSDWADIVAIAAGAYHTVGLKSDGTVVAVGGQKEYDGPKEGENDGSMEPNEYAEWCRERRAEYDEWCQEMTQCNTGDWKDIVAIAAGDYHTVGLKADGTVVAVGRNKEGQCNTENWFSVGVNAPPPVKALDESKVATMMAKINEAKQYSSLIAPCIQRTFALMPDGRVIAAENIDKIIKDNANWKDSSWNYCDVSGWKDIVAISGTGYHVAGLRKDGTVVATGYNNRNCETAVCRCDTSDWHDIISISAGVLYTIGVQRDGHVVRAGTMRSDDDEKGNSVYVDFDFSDWTDIVAVSAQKFYCLGLKSDGTVVYKGDSKLIKQYKIEDTVSTWSNVVAISAGFQHALGLRADGTVVAAGDNGLLQCEVSRWRDCVAISAGTFQSLGLCADGTVYVSGTNYDNCFNGISKLERVKAVYATTSSSVCLLDDSDVIRVGENDLDQCNVSNLRFFRNPEKRQRQQALEEETRRKLKGLEEEARRQEQSRRWAEQGLCRYCGGQLGGIFTKKCKRCGKTN